MVNLISLINLGCQIYYSSKFLIYLDLFLKSLLRFIGLCMQATVPAIPFVICLFVMFYYLLRPVPSQDSSVFCFFFFNGEF